MYLLNINLSIYLSIYTIDYIEEWEFLQVTTIILADINMSHGMYTSWIDYWAWLAVRVQDPAFISSWSPLLHDWNLDPSLLHLTMFYSAVKTSVFSAGVHAAS